MCVPGRWGFGTTWRTLCTYYRTAAGRRRRTTTAKCCTTAQFSRRRKKHATVMAGDLEVGVAYNRTTLPEPSMSSSPATPRMSTFSPLFFRLFAPRESKKWSVHTALFSPNVEPSPLPSQILIFAISSASLALFQCQTRSPVFYIYVTFQVVSGGRKSRSSTNGSAPRGKKQLIKGDMRTKRDFDTT